MLARRTLTAALVATALGATAPAAEAFSTWRSDPDWSTYLPGDGGADRLPQRWSEIDAWSTDRDGYPKHRLRQSTRRKCFTAKRGGRCRVRYSRRRVVTAYDAARYGVAVYVWRG